MKFKSVSLAILSLTVSSLALAAEYEAPAVGFKTAYPSNAEAKTTEFNENYKVEGAVKIDRQIASEKDAADREPSSIVAQDKKHEVDEDKKEDKLEPKPWMYRNKLDTAY